MKNSTIIGGVGVAVALVLSVLAITNQPTEKVVREVVEKQVQVGAIPGDSWEVRCPKINGVQTCFDSLSFQQATSTFCVVPRPSATSTLKSFTGKNTSATSTTVVYVLEKVTNPYAPWLAKATSTNVIASGILAANSDVAFTYVATSSSVGFGVGKILVDEAVEISPSDYLVFYGKNGGGGTINQAATIGSVFTGWCKAEMTAVQ